jgi:uncharacterized protein (DUF1810 family)
MSDDPFDLERFVTAQNGRVAGDATAYEAALAELRAGRNAPTGCGSCSLRWPGSGRPT